MTFGKLGLSANWHSANWHREKVGKLALGNLACSWKSYFWSNMVSSQWPQPPPSGQINGRCPARKYLNNVAILRGNQKNSNKSSKMLSWLTMTHSDQSIKNSLIYLKTLCDHKNRSFELLQWYASKEIIMNSKIPHKHFLHKQMLIYLFFCCRQMHTGFISVNNQQAKLMDLFCAWSWFCM